MFFDKKAVISKPLAPSSFLLSSLPVKTGAGFHRNIWENYKHGELENKNRRLVHNLKNKPLISLIHANEKKLAKISEIRGVFFYYSVIS